MAAALARLLPRFQQFLQPDALVPIERHREAQAAYGYFEDLPAVPPLELHAKRVEPAFNDRYVVCSCGYIGLPSVLRDPALVCPVEEAEAERLRNRQRFQARLVNAWVG